MLLRKIILLFLPIGVAGACLLFNVQVCLAGAFSLSGDWVYQDSRSSTDSLIETYVADFNKTVDFTEAMSLNAGVRYNRRIEVDNTKDNISPSLSWLVKNDLFYFNLFGNATEESNSDDTSDKSSRSLAANLNSAWLKKGWQPSVTLSFNQSWSEDDLSPHVSDADSTGTGVNLSWNFMPFAAYYSYHWQENNDNVSGSQRLNENHFAKIDASTSFWQDKGAVTLSQKYSYSVSENRERVTAGIALIQQTVTAYFAESVVNPVVLSSVAQLTDADRSVVALTVTNPVNPANFGVRTNFKEADKLYLYTDTALTGLELSAFSWDLYSSNNNNTWTLESVNISPSYNSAFKRFEFNINGHLNEYLKVVASSAPPAAVNFTEVEVYQEVSASGATTSVTSNSTTYQTDVNVSLQLRPDLQLTASVAYGQNNNSNSSDSSSIQVNSGLGWNPIPDWTVRVNNNISIRSRDNAPDDESRSYGFNLAFPTIPSVSSVFGATMSEVLQGSDKLSTNYNYNLQFVADLYTDLNSRLNISLNQNDDKVSGEKSEATTVNLNLTARLIPALVADWSSTYNKSSGQRDSLASNVNLNWRVSDMLSARAGASQTWTTIDSSSLSFGFDVAMTSNMQISLSQSFSLQPETSKATSMSWRWSITQYISLLTSGSYTKSSGSDSWSILSKLNARYTTL